MKNTKRLPVFAVIGMLALGAAANDDVSEMHPYTLEDPLTFLDGTKVKTAADWRKRRAEILDLFQREMYGRLPPKPTAMVTELLDERET